MNSNSKKEIPGYFITFNYEEEKILSKFFESIGFDFDIDGIKEFLLNCAKNRKQKSSSDNLIQTIIDNPEVINQAWDFGKKITDKIFKK